MGSSHHISWPRTVSIIQLYPEQEAQQGQHPARRLDHVWGGVVDGFFEHGFWDGGKGQLIEVEMLDPRYPLPMPLVMSMFSSCLYSLVAHTPHCIQVLIMSMPFVVSLLCCIHALQVVALASSLHLCPRDCKVWPVLQAALA